jgi:twitching motility two-component system response regulator PilH
MSTASVAAGQKKKILVVDDNPIILKTLFMKLRGAGYEVIAAQDGAEGVAAARKQKPDLVLLDIVFPPEVSGVPWDGFKLMTWLQRLDKSRHLPIIIITGEMEEKHKQRALANGAIGFFTKPINFDALLDTIRATLSDQAPAPA